MTYERTNTKDDVDGGTFGHSSIGSSISSLYRNFDIHFEILKITGVIVLLSIMSVTLALTSNIYSSEKKQNTTRTDSIKLANIDTIEQFNMSSCSYIKQYHLPGNYFVTICTYQSRIRVDVRLFLNGKPTIRGFFLNRNQYRYFKRLIPHINKAVKSAGEQQRKILM